ncbi:MAG: ComEC/Rec2 family competence protein [Brevinematia bacterium]
MNRLVLLTIFISILSGLGVGILLCTYDYPYYFERYNFLIKDFPKIFLLLSIISIVLILSKKGTLSIISIAVLLFYLSLSYSFIKSKIRLDELIATSSSNTVVGKVKISFLDKIFVETSNKTVIVYLKKYDKEFTSLDSEIFVVGKSKHIYSYLTNKDRYGYFLYLFENNVPYIVYSEDDSIVESVESDSHFFKAANTLRQDIFNKFSKFLPNTSFLSISLIIGESSGISKEFKENIINVGISHIFSVSGFHVGVIVGAMVLFLGILRIPKLGQFILITIFLAIYSYIVGLKPPAVRASILASVILLTRSFKFYPNYLNVTLITGIIMLLIDPFLSIDIGFILSFLAVIAIILFANYINHMFIKIFNKNGIEPSSLTKGIISLFSVSFVSVLFTLPIIIIWFGSASLTGILSSILLVPLSSLNITSGIISYITSLFSETIAQLMFRSVNLLNIIFIIITNLFSKITFFINFKITNPLSGLIFLISYYILLMTTFVVLPRVRLKTQFLKQKV